MGLRGAEVRFNPRLGPYEILAQIGAGGMGEVYRAKDTKLKRHVAWKVLPHALAHDADRPQIHFGLSGALTRGGGEGTCTELRPLHEA